MGHNYRTIIYANLLTYLLLANVACPSPIEDVAVQFYMLQLDQWISQGLDAKFKLSLAQGLCDFCLTNFTACGANSSSTGLNFTQSAVHFVPGYPEKVDSHYLNLRLYISYNLPGSTDIFNLSAVDTTTILENYRLQIYEQIGYYMVYINDNFFTIPPPRMTNIIVVSASCGFTLLLIVIAMILRRCYPDDPNQLLKRRQAADPMRRLNRRVAERLNGHAKAAAAATGSDGVECAPEADGDEAAGRRNPGFSGSRSPHRAEDSNSHLSDSASPAPSPTDDEAPAAGGAVADSGGRRRRTDREAVVVDSSEQIMLSEAANSARNGNGVAKINKD